MQSNFTANIEKLNVCFINNYTVNSERGGGGAIQYQLTTNHFPQISFH